LQTAPTSPTFRNSHNNQGSAVKFKNAKEIEYKHLKKKEEKRVRKKSISSKRPGSGHNKAKISIKKHNISPGRNSKQSNQSAFMKHKRTSSNAQQNFYVTPTGKYKKHNPEMTQQNLMLTKVMNGTFFETENRGKRNNSNLAPSKTQQERYKIYNTGTGITNGPVKIKVLSNDTGDSNNRNMFAPDKTSDSQVNRTYDTRRGSKTGRKKLKVVSNFKRDIRIRPKIMSYKTSIPTSDISESHTMQEKPTVKPVADIKKVFPTQDVDNDSKEVLNHKRIKNQEPNKTEDRRDSTLLKKLTEVHSFPRPPIPKLEDTLD
jgi:hypothetical protein